MPVVKVCGLTNLEDARLAWELGAAALGFVFHAESPRAITVSQAIHIRAELPPEAVCVGVFVDRNPSEIQSVAEAVGLSAVQLHGRETPETVARLNLPVLKAIRTEDALDEGRLRAFAVAAFLLDASHPTLAGGTGLCADWTLAQRLAQRFPLILAGGLHPGNVREAFAKVNPRGLDLSSGIEAEPGRKDPQKLRELFQFFPFDGERLCLF
ncbi:MAG: phosphoribosylanthranilate isomerase [Holophaga sp.]|nr:phosphoribosylanthranilate isomerase [Holophaga sp.]